MYLGGTEFQREDKNLLKLIHPPGLSLDWTPGFLRFPGCLSYLLVLPQNSGQDQLHNSWAPL
jgi:hypothetical protein